MRVREHVPKRNVSVQGKRYGVHEFGCIRNEGKERDSKEFFINSRSLEDDIHNINEQLCKPGLAQKRMLHESTSNTYRQ